MAQQANRCQCRYCARSPFTQLLHTAQADEDTSHRQEAMDVISWAAPYAGTGAGALVKPHLNRLYPTGTPPEEDQGQGPASAPAAPPQPAVSARIAEIQRQAIDAARHIPRPQ